MIAGTETIDLTHGAGGRATARLIQSVFAAAFDHPALLKGDDGAVLPAPAPGEKLVASTDAHVVSPLFFPGGDIGTLSVFGTVNDIAMMGARPLYLTAGFILEEGFPVRDLRRVVQSMADASRQANVAIVAGDTKVVEKGHGDGLFITTSGIGALPAGRCPSGHNAREGDIVLVSGPLGAHGITILNARESLGFEADIQSDACALNDLVETLYGVVDAADIHVLRDPTRGGLATTLNEIAHQSSVGIDLDETAIPVTPQVRAACDFLGLDPLNLANEGKLIVICKPRAADAVLQAMRQHPLGREAAVIGRVINDTQKFVTLRTAIGGKRMLDWLNADPLPRIC